MIDYLPLVLILGGLGAMAWFMTTRGAKGHQARRAEAESRRWKYQELDASIIVTGAESDRNLLYRVDGKDGKGSEWWMVARGMRRIRKSAGHTLQLGASTEWRSSAPFQHRLALIPTDGRPIPDVVREHMLRLLGLPTDIRQLSGDELPAGLTALHAVFAEEGADTGAIAAAAAPLQSWRSKHKHQDSGITLLAGPDGIRMQTLFPIENPADMAAFATTGIAFVDHVAGRLSHATSQAL